MKNAYITRLVRFLPNTPVSNGDMEHFLGMINGKPCVAKRLILLKNKITARYYALDNNGNATHTNAGMTAAAVNGLFRDGITRQDIQLLACGTTSPDQLLPSHAAMVHGLLGPGNLDIGSFSGACCSGMQSLKYAYLSVISGNSRNAVSTGSERLSSWLKSDSYNNISDEDVDRLNTNNYVAFEKAFLRWMLSDGAGAALLQDQPAEGLNLKIEWIDITSFAGDQTTCMYAGGEQLEDGSFKGWHEFKAEDWKERSLMALHQDIKLLSSNIVRLGMEFLSGIVKSRGFDIRSIDYFLPHLSSDFFREPIMNALDEAGMHIPSEKWFTNLATVGNVGAASAYLMLEELFYSGRLKKDDKILLMVPESARFSYSFCLLTVC
jgi:3-oxoacyl-[acyl-carrier-protein] synthase III